MAQNQSGQQTGASLDVADDVQELMSNRPLEGDVALVTGGSGAMGSNMAVALGALGADVAVHYHSSKADATAVVDAVEGYDSTAVPVQADVTDVADVEEMYQQVIDEFGRLDILINTAGVMLKKPLEEVSEDEYDRMFDIHTKGTFFNFREAARCMNDDGRILNFSTTLTGVMTGQYSVYAGAKAATEQFTKMLAKEVGNRGITVNTVAPGPADTSFYYPDETEESTERYKSMSIGNRLTEVGDVVPLLAFLSSEEAGWITGQTIRINGGLAD
ncbi:3-oxoacyl-ACP reductase [Natrialba taiwanensis DSM 12281]|uniref:3-oxoacyl-ACP reductase n=2 Tax=Natrialba taiwanensis TaxID=160846 RepID=M0AHE6_9EURY|nr:3-oxoacyl-ACP reductase [Natrialba taiwanensis DSM 12281]